MTASRNSQAMVIRNSPAFAGAPATPSGLFSVAAHALAA